MNSKLNALAVTAFLVGSVGNADAALQSRLGGLAVYDTDLNITWLADANYAKTSGYDVDGLMNWQDAVTWASNLSYGGFTDWRLPTTNITPFCGGINCTNSEMGHLFYNELGGTGHSSILASSDPDLALFSNIQATYWSGTDAGGGTAELFFFRGGNQDFNGGIQAAGTAYSTYSAWAVRSGDVSPAPEPASAWLFGFGLLALLGVPGIRRKVVSL